MDHETISVTDFSDVKGQENVKRALEIASAGSHNIIMIGPPGAGKTMMAKSIVSILPPLNQMEALETSKIYSSRSLFDPNRFCPKERRQYRNRSCKRGETLYADNFRCF